MTQLRQALGLTLIATALSGCIGFLEPDYLLPAKRVEKVREIADLYGQYVRFGRIPEAAAFVRKEDRKAFLDAFMSPSSRVEFTNAEIVTVEPATAMTVEVWARYDFFALPSIEVRSLTEKQIWHYDAMRRTWQVQPDLTVFPGSPAASSAVPSPAG